MSVDLDTMKTDAPGTQTMSDGVSGLFGTRNALLVKQTTRGCLQECLGCEAKSEFTVAPLDWKNVDKWRVNEEALNEPDIMYALEESSCCCRLCWRDGRPFDMVVSEYAGKDDKGKHQGGKEQVVYKKPCGFPLYFSIPTEDGSIDCPCCCLLPKVDTHQPGPDGAPMGSTSSYVCDQNLFVPKLKYSENGEDIYYLRPETCCAGCCVACSCGSGNGFGSLAFFFHTPDDMDNPVGGAFSDTTTPQIRKVWGGLKKECCTTADTFAVQFPADITPERKAGLLGLTFLLDFTVFERQGEGK